MLKRLMFGVVAATFVGTAAAGQYVFEEPYWKATLSQPAAANQPARESGVQIIQQQQAAKDALDHAGFSQYNN